MLGKSPLAGAPIAGSGESPPSAVLAGTSTLTAVGTSSIPPPPPEVTLAGTSSLTVIGLTIVRGSAVLSGTSSFTANGFKEIFSSARLAGTSSLFVTVPFIQTADPRTQKIPYRVVIVGMTGTRFAELENATIGHPVWELNGRGSFSFSIPTIDPKTVHIKTAESEVQLWRGQQLIWWGVVARREYDDKVMNVQCAGLKWYFKKRFVGKVDRTNHVQNPSFEPPQYMGNWSQALNPSEPSAGRDPSYVSMSLSTERSITGERSLRLERTNDTYPKYGWGMFTSFLWTVGSGSPKGDIWTAAAWCYIPDSTWRAPDDGSYGFGIGRYSTTETVLIGPEDADPSTWQPTPKVIEGSQVPITNNTPRDTWIRLETQLVTPYTGQPEFVNVQLQCPKGVIFWDEVTLTRNERLAFYSSDQALIVKGLVEHAQDPVFLKSTLNIGTNCQLTGIIREREYPHSEHQIIEDALDEFPTLQNGMDFDIEFTPTTRTATTYFPRKGIARPNIVLELGRNISTFRVIEDGEETANSIVVLGDGEGSDREEGGAQDATALAGGLILEKVYNATPGSAIRTLDDQAQRGLQRFKKPVVIPQITTHESAGHLVGVLRTGDVHPVRLKYETIDVTGDYRIIRIELDPETDQMMIGINPAETSF